MSSLLDDVLGEIANYRAHSLLHLRAFAMAKWAKMIKRGATTKANDQRKLVFSWFAQINLSRSDDTAMVLCVGGTYITNCNNLSDLCNSICCNCIFVTLMFALLHLTKFLVLEVKYCKRGFRRGEELNCNRWKIMMEFPTIINSV